VVIPYFAAKGITLVELNQKHLQDFYTAQLDRVKAKSVIHYHANIHKALKYAVKMDMIPTNPADKVERPKPEIFVGSFLDSNECNRLYEAAKGTKLEMAVLFGIIYGLRRSEVVGLRWKAIDFANDTITINHTVISCHVDGHKEMLFENSTKSKSSYRVLPLLPFIKSWLIERKANQDDYMRLCGRSYCRDYLDYIYVDEMGYIINPDYVSRHFTSFLEKNGIRPVRLHDLRHPYVKQKLKNILFIFKNRKYNNYVIPIVI